MVHTSGVLVKLFVNNILVSEDVTPSPRSYPDTKNAHTVIDPGLKCILVENIYVEDLVLLRSHTRDKNTNLLNLFHLIKGSQERYPFYENRKTTCSIAVELRIINTLLQRKSQVEPIEKLLNIGLLTNDVKQQLTINSRFIENLPFNLIK